jgi:hypothetical protein|tara:strand:+ start:5653 stop:6024 length:372 start_codon:yes stop_codon:yes gene_type:complete
MKKIVTWLYKKFKKPGIEELVLEELSLASYVIDFKKMSKEDKDNFLHECYMLNQNEVSKKVRDTLITAQRDITLEKSTGEKALLCGRSTFYGIMMYDREIERYAMMHKERLEMDKVIDKHEII